VRPSHALCISASFSQKEKEKEKGKEKGREGFDQPAALLLALTYGLHSPAILPSKLREP
jgi:hypothetical protein